MSELLALRVEIDRLRGVLHEIAIADDCWETSSGCAAEMVPRPNWCVFCLAKDAIGDSTPDNTSVLRNRLRALEQRVERLEANVCPTCVENEIDSLQDRHFEDAKQIDDLRRRYVALRAKAQALMDFDDPAYTSRGGIGSQEALRSLIALRVELKVADSG